MATRNSFATARWKRTINLVLQAGLFITLFGGLNYLALHHGWRWDLTAHSRHTLSEETKAYLRSLDQPVRLVITTNPNNSNADAVQAFRDIRGLLREYENATASKSKGKITVEELDIYRDQRAAEALQSINPMWSSPSVMTIARCSLGANSTKPRNVSPSPSKANRS
jgi:ABC-type uncharacterized transport system involved in gliding motility auxiliary subunit